MKNRFIIRRARTYMCPRRWPELIKLAGLAFIATWPTSFTRAQASYGTPYFFTTFAGSGVSGSADGTGIAATFSNPADVAFDAAGNLLVADSSNGRIRRITRTGVVTTLNGPGGSPLALGPIHSIAVDGSGNIFVGGYHNHTIQKITTAGVVSTLAGQNFVSGTADGTGSTARFNYPIGIAIDSSGNLFVADGRNGAIRKVTQAGEVTTIAGLAGTSGYANGIAGAARFNEPWAIEIDGAGSLYVTDSANHAIRKITNVGIAGGAVVTTLAGTPTVPGTLDATGTAAQFRYPAGVALDASGNIYVSSTGSSTIRKITPGGVVTTLAGAPGVDGNADGLGAQAQFHGPYGLALDARGNLYVADSGNDKIRRSVFPPSIEGWSANATVELGANIAFNASLSATSDFFPHTYQWRKDGSTIFGATRASLPLGVVQASDAGTYSVTVTNVAGSATATTTLTVVSPPTITTQPISQTVTAGSPVQLSVAFSSSLAANVQWRRNGVAIPGATNALFAIASAALTDAGSYSAAVSNSVGMVTSSAATLTVTVPVSTTPITHTVTVGSPVQFNYTGTPGPETIFQWQKDGTPIPGATSAGFTINSASLTDAGNYNVVTTHGTVPQLSNTATLIVIPISPPVITTQPVSRTATVGATVQFGVAATSALAPGFQWRKNGISIPGATAGVLTLFNVSLSDAATYAVAVTNAGGTTISSNATLSVTPPVGIAPGITTQPADQTISAGATISLGAAATGTQPLSFQWFKNGAALPGATALSFSITNAQPADAASYSVVVNNSAGAATSNAAVVRVVVPPTISTPPAAQIAAEGERAEFSVASNGTPPFTYAWLKDGVVIAGATASTLTFNPVLLANAGSYTVAITNSAGTATSAAATLTVAPGSRLANVSIRTALTTGQTVIVGLAVEGGSREMLVRAVGPSLAAFSVTGAMADPRIELFRNSSLVVANEDWSAALAPTFTAAGAFGLTPGSRDAAFRQSLNGAFSIQARGTGAGVVLVEAYDLGERTGARLVNVSARNRVGTGDDILIAGFTIVGTGAKQLLIRAVGPGLAVFGLSGTLSDPRADVFSASGVRLAENDNWNAALAPTFSAVGAFALPVGSRDAAVVASLPAGAYTVQVRGADGGVGEAIVEVYEVP